MKKLMKQLAVLVTAITLVIGFSLPATVFADIDEGTKTITVNYTHEVYTGKTCTHEQGTYYIGSASFNWFVNWYHDGQYQYPSVKLEEGETYTVEVSVTKANEYAQPYDLSGYTLNLTMLGQPFPYDSIIQKEAATDRIRYTYQVTPKATPDNNLGAGTVDLSKGPYDIASDPGVFMTLMVMSQTGHIATINAAASEDQGIVDLDLDGKADVEMVIDNEHGKMTLSAYGDVTGKAPIALKLTDEELTLLADVADGMPYYSSLTFIFEAATPDVTPTDVTPVSKAVIKDIKAKVYTGKALKPSPKVVLKGKTLRANKDYTVSYKKNVNVGTATVVVRGKGLYSGTKTATFKIIPKGTGLKSVAGASKAVKVKWTKQSAKMKTSRITGYQILLAANSKFTKGKKTVNVAGYSKVSKKAKGLKGGIKYYVKIRTYKKIGKTKYYSKWSAVKTVTTKK